MRVRHRMVGALFVSCALVVGLAGPAGAQVRTPAPKTVAGPTCQINDPEIITGATVVNNQIVNGTWHYATGVVCNSNLADIELYEELDYNGAKVDSLFKGFTGVPRTIDAIFSQFVCNVCNGNWNFVWAQIIKAPVGFLFTSPPAGCVLFQNGLYQACVEMKAVTL